MASAAAVAANEARSPIGNDIGEDSGRPGEITSGIYSKDEGLPDVNGEINDEEEDDEDLPADPTQGHPRTRPVNGDAEDEDEELFGDDDEDPIQPKRRQLDNENLDSGDDMERRDRVSEEEQEQEFVEQQKVTMDLEIPRQPIPEPSDGEMYLLKMPNFMAIEPKGWDHQTYQPPATDHHSHQKPSETFSAYNTALTTIRWRHSPSDPLQLQSNARINRWSDGSLTLQLASEPTTQYEFAANLLAPPQRNPIKPTPTSIQPGSKSGKHGAGLDEKYDQSKDAFTYLIRPHEASGTMIVAHKITAGLSVKQSSSVEDDAIERLQASLAAASNASKVNGASGVSLVQIEEDPDLARAKALAAQREKERQQRKHQSAIEREAARSDRVLGRKGMPSNRYSGLNVGMLEDEEMGGEGVDARGRPSPNKARKARRRRNSEYSEDEDLGRRRFTGEDEYDQNDDFLAPSDEEEVVEDDDDSDDGIVEDQDASRERTPKRDRPPPELTGDEADAPGEEEDEEEVQQARAKRRRIIDEDEDE